MNTTASNAGWILSKLGDILFQFAIVGFGLLVIVTLSGWLNIGILGTSVVLLLIGLLIGVIGYRLQNGEWEPLN